MCRGGACIKQGNSVDSVVAALRVADVRIRGRLSSVPTWVLSISIVGLMVLKTGLNFTPQPEGGIERDIWPAPSGHLGGSSYGMRAVIIYLDLRGFRELAAIGILLTFIFISLIVLSLRRAFQGDLRRIALVLTLSSPLVAIAFSYIGRYDIFVLIGAWLVAISHLGRLPRATTTLGISFMLLGNPEHTAVAGFILLMGSIHPLLRPYKSRAIAAFAAGAVAVVITAFWASLIGASSRLTYWPQYLQASWNNFFPNLPIVLYSGYAILWIVVMLTLAVATRKQRLVLIFALIAIPSAVVATTLDQTRVFVGLVALPISALTISWLQELDKAQLHPKQTSRLLVFTLALALLLPSIEVDQRGLVRGSYEWFAYLQSVGVQWF